MLLARKLNTPESIIKHAKELTLAYIYTRYPDVPEIKGIKFKGSVSKEFPLQRLIFLAVEPVERRTDGATSISSL